MFRGSVATGVLIAGLGALAISACGSSSGSSTPSAAGSSAPAGTSTANALSPAGAPPNGSGSDFCRQAAQVAVQLRGLSASLGGGAAGATPNIGAYHHVFGAVTQAIDGLDGSAPGEIASAFHQLRAIYDQLNTQVQGATSMQQMSSAFSGLNNPSIATSSTAVTDYFQKTCGISPSASP